MPITFGLGKKKLLVAQFGHASGIGDVNKLHRFLEVISMRVVRRWYAIVSCIAIVRLGYFQVDKILIKFACAEGKGR